MLMLPKTPIVRDRRYLDWLRGQPCIVTGRDGVSEPAHLRLLGSGGTGMKPSDARCLPLNHSFHRQQSEIGEPRAWLTWAQEYPEFYFKLLIDEAERRYAEWKA